jgi:hypothetical protein
MSDLDSDSVIEKLSSSLSVEACRLLAAVIRNSRQKPKDRRWNFEDRVLALALMKCSKSYILLQTLFPFHQDELSQYFSLYDRHQYLCV